MTNEELLLALYTDMQEMKSLLENRTNRNIKLLAESHGNLIDKLNQAVKVSDKTLFYEIQLNSLKWRVETLEKEFAELKAKIA